MPAAQAASVRGTVTLPAQLRGGRRFPGYWRLENGNVPVAATGRSDTFVVLAGVKAHAPAPKTYTVELKGLAAEPATIVVSEGSVVEFKNNDRVPHDLSIPGEERLMALERLAPNTSRRQKFLVAGGYVVRCSEYPHLLISVIVLTSPHSAAIDDRGAFRIADAPEGKTTLKVWSGGRWVHEQEIDVGSKSQDIRITVVNPAARAAAAVEAAE